MAGRKPREVEGKPLDSASDSMPLYAKVAGSGDPNRLLEHAIADLERLKRGCNDKRREQIEESLRLLRSFLVAT